MYFNVKKIAFVYLLQMIGLGVFAQSSLYEGDSCFLKNTTNIGECRLTINCPSFMLIAENEITLRNSKYQFTLCGYSGRYQVVCCPELSNTNTVTGRPTDPVTERVTRPTRPTNPTNPGITVRTPNLSRKATRQCRIYSERIRNMSILRPQILNGEIALPNEFPHMAALGYFKDNELSYNCGGTLISDRYILTAGHCVQTRDNIPPSVVKMGTIALEDDGITLGIESIQAYPTYNTSLRYDDVALIRLNATIDFLGYLYPACLDTDTNNPRIPMIATGWGQTSLQSSRSPYLLKANFTAVGFTQCNTEYSRMLDLLRLPNGIQRSQICIINRAANNSDTCQGDSGGPLQVESIYENMYKIVGITSFGRTCGDRAPSVDARVSSYLDWIENIVWP